MHGNDDQSDKLHGNADQSDKSHGNPGTTRLTLGMGLITCSLGGVDLRMAQPPKNPFLLFSRSTLAMKSSSNLGFRRGWGKS